MDYKVVQKEQDTLGPLSKQQQAAVRAKNRRVLVLAGAGAGKTRTLLQKILF